MDDKTREALRSALESKVIEIAVWAREHGEPWRQARDEFSDAILALFDEATEWVPVSEAMPPTNCLLWVVFRDSCGEPTCVLAYASRERDSRVDYRLVATGYLVTTPDHPVTHWSAVCVPVPPKEAQNG